MGLAAMRRQGACIMAGLIAPVLVGVASAGPETAAQAFGSALKTWAAEHRIKRAFIIVRRDGRTIAKSAIGGADADAPVHLASLSKAITAACVATLVRDGNLAFTTPVSAALAKFIAAHGKPRDPRLEQVTIAQLLTHRAGFATGDDDDPASGRNLDRYLKVHTSRAPAKSSLLAAVLRARLVRGPGAQFSYGNAAYFVLGAMVEEASGAPYLAYCGEAVLKARGLKADLEPAWRVSAAMGGWRMRGEDYLKFFDLLDPAEPLLGAAAKTWMLDSGAKSVPFDSTAWYGLGTYLRKAEHGVDIWHWGSWDYTPEAGEKGTERSSFVAYAMRMSDGTAWFVHAEPRVEEGAPRRELAAALLQAYRSVKRWD